MANFLGTSSNNNLIGGFEADYIRGLAGQDTVNAGAGADTIFAGSGADSILGDDGGDIILGQQGSDTLDGGLGDDLIAGGIYDGESIPGGEADDDLIFGNLGNDTISGQTGNDVLYGGDGNDVLNGGEGNDVLYGGEGSDTLNGGSGNDIVFYRNAENLTVTEVVDAGAGTDRLHLSVTTAEWANRPFQNDIAKILQMIAQGDTTSYTLTSTGMTIRNFEKLTVDVQGMELDPVNELVVPVNDAITLSEDSVPVAVNLLANDYVPDRAAEVVLLNESSYGKVTIVSDLLALTQTAIATFTPGALAQTLRQGEVVQEVLTYRVTDVDDSTGTASLILTIMGQNDLATITGLSVGRITDGVIPPITGNLRVNDVDRTENVFQAPPSLKGIYGDFTVDGVSGDWTYTLNQTAVLLKMLSLDEQAQDKLTLVSLDGTATVTIVITVVGINDLPTLKAAVLATKEDGAAVQVDMTTLGDDIDNDNSPTDLNYSIETMPGAGKATLINNILKFDPGADYQHLAEGEVFTEVIKMKVTDRHGGTASNDVSIKLTGVNDLVMITGSSPVSYVMQEMANGLRGYTVSGSFTYQDVDLLDNHTATFADLQNMQGATGMLINVIPPDVRGGVGSVYWRFDALEGSPILGQVKNLTINLTDTPGATVQHVVGLTIPDIVVDPDDPDAQYSQPVSVDMLVNELLRPFSVRDFLDIPESAVAIASRDPAKSSLAMTFHGELGLGAVDSQYVFLQPNSAAYQYLATDQFHVFLQEYTLTVDGQAYDAKIALNLQGARLGIYGTDEAQVLGGSSEDEVFHSGSGNDTLTSGSQFDSDVFAYMSLGAKLKPDGTPADPMVTIGTDIPTNLTGVDVITDFSRGSDHMGISASGFGGGLVAGSSTFNLVNLEDRSNFTFTGTGGVLIFDNEANGGTLYWDADGGSANNAVAVARLMGVSQLATEDFFIFA